MYSIFSEKLEELIKSTEKVEAQLLETGMKDSTPTILHPRVWKDEEEAIRAATDSDYRNKMELVKKLERKFGDI